MKYQDYYETLGVARDATQDEIKQAYRKLARQHHPDLSKESGAEDRFKALGEAYEVMKDPEKRAAYDQLGADFKAGQDFRPPPDWDTGFEHSGDFAEGDGAAFSDFFETLFGAAAAAQHRGRAGGFHARGRDRHAKVLIDLEDSYHGATRAISLRLPVLDPDGRVQLREHKLNVHIPKGVRQGQHIRLSGQGEAGIGDAPAGDLYLEIAFKPHPLYRVEGRDLYLDLPVAPWEAALGAKVKVPTPEGAVSLSVPAGSGQGRRMRLKGRGIPGKPAGDLYVMLQLSLPPADSDEAKALYSAMAQELSFNPRAKLGV